MKKWTTDSWKKYESKQQPEYKNRKNLEEVLDKIRKWPSLVYPGEINKLKSHLSSAEKGEKFILQGGDCAEKFSDCREEVIRNKLEILLQMSVILTYGSRKQLIRIGRIAGQYSKPRSNSTEFHNDLELPVYRGDSVNCFTKCPDLRQNDPGRLETGFLLSALTLNSIRGLISGGFANLHNSHSWGLSEGKYKETLDKILDSIDFVESFNGINKETLDKVDFFISHEGLILDYEESLTKKDPSTGLYYNAGTHMLWIGDRTRDINGGHVEYFRGINNPIGIKAGPTMDKHELTDLINRLNPDNEEGKIVLISRMGKEKSSNHLPGLIECVKKSRLNASWCCDPMHGNTITTKEGVKTRNFNDILQEVKTTFRMHKETGSHLSGIHFELTGEHVTECTGGLYGPAEEELSLNYATYCDPRLNRMQSLEMAFLISDLLKAEKS